MKKFITVKKFRFLSRKTNRVSRKYTSTFNLRWVSHSVTLWRRLGSDMAVRSSYIKRYALYIPLHSVVYPHFFIKTTLEKKLFWIFLGLTVFNVAWDSLTNKLTAVILTSFFTTPTYKKVNLWFFYVDELHIVKRV